MAADGHSAPGILHLGEVCSKKGEPAGKARTVNPRNCRRSLVAASEYPATVQPSRQASFFATSYGLASALRSAAAEPEDSRKDRQNNACQ